MMSQKEAVYSAVTSVCQVIEGVPTTPTKEQRAQVNLILFEGFRAGTIQLERQFSDVELKFPNPCRLDDVISFSGRVAGKSSAGGRDEVRLDVRATNQAGKLVAVGTIAAQLPR